MEEERNTQQWKTAMGVFKMWLQDHRQRKISQLCLSLEFRLIL